MRSVIITAPGEVAVHDVPYPALPGPDGAVVAVSATAVCGSDLHFYDGDLPLFPVAPGHEVVGTVAEVGAGVTSVAVGDRVMVASVAGCGACAGCATLDPIACHAGGQVFGSGTGLDGGQAEFLAVPAADFNLLALPPEIDDDAALLLTDNLGTGWAGAQRADVPPGGTVLVLGLGAVGLCAVRSAFALGAARVLAVDPVAGRRDRAAASGAIAVDPGTDGGAQAVLELTGGRGADAVIDAVATVGSMDTAFAAVRTGATISVVGIHSLEPYPFPLLMGVFRSLTVRMTTAPVHRTWRELVPLVAAGRLDTAGIVTHSFGLEQAAEAYATAAARRPDVGKVRLDVPSAAGTASGAGV